jgi:hypothetical protein
MPFKGRQVTQNAVKSYLRHAVCFKHDLMYAQQASADARIQSEMWYLMNIDYSTQEESSGDLNAAH